MSEDKNEGRELTDSEKETMKTAVRASSLAHVAKACAVGEQSLTKAVAGIPVQRGTISLIRDFLRKASQASQA